MSAWGAQGRWGTTASHAGPRLGLLDCGKVAIPASPDNAQGPLSEGIIAQSDIPPALVRSRLPMPSTMPTGCARIHLVRHGTVASPWAERIYGDLDVPLSTEGEAQSRMMAQGIQDWPLAAVVSSDLARATYAAHQVAKSRSLQPVEDARLRELNRGDWAGWGRDQVEAAEPGGWARFWDADGITHVPGGETLDDLRARVLSALTELATAYTNKEVLIVAHKWVLRVALAETLGLDLSACSRLDIPHMGGATVDWSPAGPQALIRMGWTRLGG